MPAENVISIELVHQTSVNYALQQNHVPIVTRLRVTNETLHDLTGLSVILTTVPEFAETQQISLDNLPAGRTVDMGIVDLRLSPAFLATLEERLLGSLNVLIRRGEDNLYSHSYPISVLAYDEWNGIQTVPEIIAAFVTPNHPDIAPILREASILLGKWTGDPSLNAYQTRDPNRVRQQMGAIYATLQEMQISYCVPPASFENSGQKIRTPDVIRQTRLGTCLDLALLFAGCAEAAGLHPILVIKEGHAFVGAWLVDQTFPESIQDDITLLTKRIAVGVREICIVETTLLAAGQNCPFEGATTAGEANLQEVEKFHFFIDIKRARSSGIRPIPQRVAGQTVEALQDPQLAPSGIVPPSDMEALVDVGSVDGAVSSRTRLDQWERKLLDLSLRNPLLNFRPTGASLPLLAPDLHDLEDALADGRDFQVLYRPMDWEATPRDAVIYRRQTHDTPRSQLVHAEFGQNRLRADLNEKETSTRLTQLFRAARTGMEENGVNTLYLALGLLVWYETPESQKPRYAPILLIPMDIVRKSVQGGYIIRRGEDEPVLNVTLLELLKQDFGITIGGMEKLPVDDHGVDVRKALSIFRQAIKDQRHWDVLDDAYLGLFTFSKFIMWNDLRTRAADLRKNQLVASLMDGALTWTNSPDFPSPERLDQEYRPQDVFCPTGADAYQLTAVAAAGKGKTFILHGPPGTGKSHTITNIIANSLASGKTVLFVAEKMAALNVVQRNLARIGLDTFCLQIHSNKSRKSEVLKQLDAALNAVRVARPDEWEAEANRLARLRGDLNAYVNALHTPRTIGCSLFDGLSRLMAVRHAPEVVKFDPSTVSSITSERRKEWDGLVRQLHIAGSECAILVDHPWKHCRLQTFIPSVRNQADEALTELRKSLDHWQQLTVDIADLFHVRGEQASYDELTALLALARHFMTAPGIPGTMIGARDWNEVQSAVDRWIEHGKTRDSLRAELTSRYMATALKLDASSLRSELKVAEETWFLPRWMTVRRVLKVLKGVQLPGISVDTSDLPAELERLERWTAEENTLSDAGDRARDLLGSVWCDGNADWDAVTSATRWASEIRKCAMMIAGTDTVKATELREHWSNLVAEYADQLQPDGKYGSKIKAFIEAADTMASAWKSLAQLLTMDTEALSSDRTASEWFVGMRRRIDRWTGALNELGDWCAWVRVRTEAQEAGLGPVIIPYEEGLLSHDQVEAAYERGVFSVWVREVVDSDPVLATFSRSLFEDKIHQFRELDHQYNELTRREVQARLAARVPQVGSSAAATSEMGILKNQIQRQRGHLALRELFQRIPNLLKKLTPCLLTSPMSVAQYLDPSHPPFDIVIFDEASQVPTWDAVGAIARGSQAVIVGDPKQLPPTSTSFFAKVAQTSDDEYLEDPAIQDLDSILEDCITLSVPEEHLRWHYRSRHESLIAFSNFNYYKNELITFPSPDDQSPAVHWRFVGGTYDRAASRQNRKEAEAVVAEVIRRLRDPKQSRQSIGIVTFNLPQQQLIEDLLEEQVRQNPEIEGLYLNGPDSGKRDEAVFIKNLENVQGDERDVIIISVGYGADSTGRVAMNFGPLNRDGGWRRLNVIVSRARDEMIVFSSMRADQLDMSRSGARGVADLRAFLEYAERGKQALLSQSSGSADAESESPFEEEVFQALREKGYTVHKQVGCSGFRIDLAVVDPERPGRYLLGVECDGATYHRAKTARDRDQLREEVLNRLGWRLHRIWSLNWWENPKREIERVEAAIADAKIRLESPDPTPAPEKTLKTAALVLASQAVLASVAPIPSVPANQSVYAPCQLEPINRDNWEFYEPHTNQLLVWQIQEVVKQEGPISYSLLCRRVVNAWGMTRVGSRIDERMRQVCRLASLPTTRSGEMFFFWPQDADPGNYMLYRVQGGDEMSRRAAEDLAPEEIANAAQEVLKAQISLPEEDLIREVARVFGYQRTGVNVTQALLRGITYLLKCRRARKETDGRIVIAS